MFDIGFTEMVVVGLVALIVLGPERLPRVAKQAGQWLGKLQRYVNDVKSDINRQMELEELRKLKTEVTEAASDLETSFRSAVSESQAEFDALASSVSGTTASNPSQPEVTDWDRIYAVRRSRDRIVERRTDRAKSLGHKVPKRRR
jgi:sec-independent protein translocase protein TatB